MASTSVPRSPWIYMLMLFLSTKFACSQENEVSLQELKQLLQEMNNKMDSKLSRIDVKINELHKIILNDMRGKLENVESEVIAAGQRNSASLTAAQKTKKQGEEVLKELRQFKQEGSQFDTAMSKKLNNISMELKLVNDQENNLFNVKLDNITLISNEMSEKLYNISDSLNLSIHKESHEMSEKLFNISDGLKLSIQQESNEISEKLSSDDLKLSIQQGSKEISTKLTYITYQLNKVLCPKDFFLLDESQQCFKAFRDKAVTWREAVAKCKSEGHVLAKPDHPVELSKYLNKRYDGAYYWLGARGDGYNQKWTRDGTVLDNRSSLYYPGWGKGTTDQCLQISAYTSNMNAWPGQQYFARPCSGTFFPLCEVIIEQPAAE